MLISVVIPAYNSAIHLPQCVDSVLSQGMSDVEVIIVDDGSEDGTWDVCRALAVKYDQVQCVHQDNKGQLIARREGYAMASGEYVMSLDSDDFLLRDSLSVISGKLKEVKPDVLMFNVKLIPGNTRFLNYPSNWKTDAFIDISEVRWELLKGPVVNNLCSKVVRRTLIDLHADYVRFQGMKMAEDALQMIAILDAASNCYLLDDCLYGYRRNNGSATRSLNPRQLQDTSLFCRELESNGERWFPGKLSKVENMVNSRYMNGVWRYFRTLARAGKLNRSLFLDVSNEVQEVLAFCDNSTLDRGAKIAAYCLKTRAYGLLRTVVGIDSILWRIKNARIN